MKIYLLIIAIFVITNAHNCQQVGSSSLANLTLCKITNPPPQLQWTINIVLKQDYAWQAANDMKYIYMTLEDQEIDQTCFQGQTIKGKYTKGTTLLIQQTCFGFKPSISRGAKMYLSIFESQNDSDARQVIYMSFNSEGNMIAKQLNDLQIKQIPKMKMKMKNLMINTQ